MQPCPPKVRNLTTLASMLAIHSLFCVCFIASPGCVTENPRSRPVPPPPKDVRPNKLLLSVNKFGADSDGNGYIDSFDATVYLFDERYINTSLAVPGRLTFRLTTVQGASIHEWALSEEATTAALKPEQAGPCYFVRLSLLERALKDNLPSQTAEMSAWFSPARGEPIRSTGGIPLRIGPLK